MWEPAQDGQAHSQEKAAKQAWTLRYDSPSKQQGLQIGFVLGSRNVRQRRCSARTGDVEMKVASETKKSTAPVQKLGTSLSELIDKATAEHRAVAEKERCGKYCMKQL